MPRKKTLFLLLIGTGCLVSCEKPPVEEETRGSTIETEWVLDGFESPESVLSTGDGNTFFVSNVVGEGRAKDGLGYISVISRDGTLIEKTWVSGLDAPKGMIISDGYLFVSDIDHLVKIDIARREITDRIPIEGASFLNDVTKSEDGILVSDSGGAKIYNFIDGTVSVWFQDDSLEGVNGLTAQADRLLITTMAKGELLSLDWKTKELTVIATGMKNADGIEQHRDGSFIVSSWPGKLYRVAPDGTYSVLLDTEADEIYMNDITLVDDTIIAPNWRPGTVRAITFPQP